MPRPVPLLPLSEMKHGQEADLFALLSGREELKTRDGKPYFRVSFRDSLREVTFPIWGDSPLAADCKNAWTVGSFFKLRAEYRDTQYGPQLDIRKIRATCEEDARDGFDPAMCRPSSRFDPTSMFNELVGLAETRIEEQALRELVVGLLTSNRSELLTLPAARRNHHAYLAGWLEHVLSVTRLAIQMADKYAEYYPDMRPPLRKELVVAGAILHDIGKLREIDDRPEGTDYSPAGHLIGHILQGRDILREAAAGKQLSSDTLLRLEHVIVSHQRLPEWGSPKPPMTAEAMLVHYADDLDAKYHMLYQALADDTGDAALTTNQNAMRQRFYKGEQGE